MTDDVSALPNAGCSYLTNNYTLVNRYGNVQRTYILLGGKWYLSRTYSTSSSYSEYNCLDVSSLSSQNAGFYPIYSTIALALAVGVSIFAFKLVRPLLRWRV